MENKGLSLKTKILIFTIVPMLGLLVYIMVNGEKDKGKDERRVGFQLPKNINPSDTIKNKEKVYRDLERRVSLQQDQNYKNKRVKINELLNSTKAVDQPNESKDLTFEERVDSILKAREKNSVEEHHPKKIIHSSKNNSPKKRNVVQAEQKPDDSTTEQPDTEKSDFVSNYGFSSFQSTAENKPDNKTEAEYYKASLYEATDIKKGQNTQVEFILNEDCKINGKTYYAQSILNGVAYYNSNGCDIIINSIKNRGEPNPIPITLYAYNERYQRGVYLVSNLDNALRETGKDGIQQGSRYTNRYYFLSRTMRNFGEAIVGGKDIPLNAGYTMFFSTIDQNR